MNNKEKLQEYQNQCVNIANTIDTLIQLIDSNNLTNDDKQQLFNIAETQTASGIFYLSEIKRIFNDELTQLTHGN